MLRIRDKSPLQSRNDTYKLRLVSKESREKKAMNCDQINNKSRNALLNGNYVSQQSNKSKKLKIKVNMAPALQQSKSVA